MDSCEEKSQRCASAVTPARSRNATTAASVRPRSRPTSRILAPSRASATAASNPMPALDPVMRTVLPATSHMAGVQLTALFVLLGRILDRQAAPRPVLERPVVQQDRVAQRLRGKQRRRRLLTDVAIRDDRVARLDAGLGEERFELVLRLQL